uniref:Uncharacterized protein n=1 Tax=Oryza brachyantha TaxID=4533 RepID=J3LZX7_ORYBR
MHAVGVGSGAWYDRGPSTRGTAEGDRDALIQSSRFIQLRYDFFLYPPLTRCKTSGELPREKRGTEIRCPTAVSASPCNVFCRRRGGILGTRVAAE